jgi:protein TonB
MRNIPRKQITYILVFELHRVAVMRIIKSQTLSLALHAGLVVILFSLSTRPRTSPRPASRDVVPLIAPRRIAHGMIAQQHAGGSNRTSLPAKHGAPPPKALRTFIPPHHEPDPKLPMAITVAFDSPTIEIEAAAIGDPSSKLLAGRLGLLGDNGIGGVDRGGIGRERSGPPGISNGTPGHKITRPELIYKVEPEFSEAARKAKFQGMVLLTIEVDTDGHARNFRIVQGLGLGLDEKAIEAVSRWRFRPGSQDGRPVVTTATVEVNFRLL